MAQYGVSTTNVFDLLDDETPRQQQKAAAAPAAKQAKQAANVKPAQSQERTEQRSNRGRGDNQRGGRGASRGGAVRTPRPTGETVTAVDTDASAGGYSEVSGDHEKRSRNTNTRGRGHGGRGRGFGDGSRREFDRRGAPRGRAPHEPRKGGHNLGDQIESQQESSEAAAPAVDGEAVATEVVAEEESAVEIEAVEFVPEDTSLTYDEFLEQQRARAVADDSADRVRRVEIDESQWKAVKPLVAAPETATETETRVRKEKKSKGKVSLDQFVGSPVGGPPPREQRDYDDNRRGGRGGNRGGRGAFRGEHRGESRGENREHRGENRGGRGGRGGNFQRGGRGGARGGANINVMDESAFPSLGGK